MSTSNSDPDDQAPDETDFDQELRDLVDGKFHQAPGFDAQYDPALNIDADVLNASNRIDPDLRKRAMAVVRKAPLPKVPDSSLRLSFPPPNPFVRLIRRLRRRFRR
jgi:hypothetical protein